MTEDVDPGSFAAERRLADKLDQVSRRLETMSKYAAKTAGELAEAVKLLQLAQGHMMEMAADMRLIDTTPSEVDRHNALTKRVGEFIRAHSPRPQAAQDPNVLESETK
jgi:hypothetical protein